jgi:hypothetical protein
VNQHKALYERIQSLRASGKTFKEINVALGMNIPKSSLSYICRNVTLSNDFLRKMSLQSSENIKKQQVKAVIANRNIFEAKLKQYRRRNMQLVETINNKNVQLLALAMLYLGEGAKWKGRRGLALGSSSPQIIQIYINLLKSCYGIKSHKLKCRIQCRADQDQDEMLTFWSQITGVPISNFYPTHVDKRTVGKPTKKLGYMGVCVVTCAGTHIQLELEQIADIISEVLGH